MEAALSEALAAADWYLESVKLGAAPAAFAPQVSPSL
jgi:hypothetical protein